MSNQGARRVAERSGFTQEGVLRDYRQLHGIWFDAAFYSRLRRQPPPPRLITGKQHPDPRASAPSATACLARQTEHLQFLLKRDRPVAALIAPAAAPGALT